MNHDSIRKPAKNESVLLRYIARKCQSNQLVLDSTKKEFAPLRECIFRRVPYQALKIKGKEFTAELTVKSTPKGFQVLVDHIFSRNGSGAVLRLMSGLCSVLRDYARHIGSDIQVDLVARGVINSKIQMLLPRFGFQPRGDIQPPLFRLLLWFIFSILLMAAIFIQMTDVFAIAFIMGFILHTGRGQDFGINFIVAA